MTATLPSRGPLFAASPDGVDPKDEWTPMSTVFSLCRGRGTMSASKHMLACESSAHMERDCQILSR